MSVANGKTIPVNRVIVLFDLSGTLRSFTGEPLPGVANLLESLHHAKVNIGVVTSSPSFEAKGFLFVNRLGRFVPVVVGNETSNAQSERIRIAVDSFRSPKNQIPIKDPEVFIVDDDLSRLSITRALDYKFIAVCTGDTTREQFEGHIYKPCAVFDDLSDTRKVLEMILKDTGRQPKPSKRSKALA